MISPEHEVKRWGIFELSMKGPEEGNPFIDVSLSAEFKYKNRILEQDGFYDGEGIYRIRFMPDSQGQWHYVVKSSCLKLDGKTGAFACVDPSRGNHGPIRVHNTYHFAYADGTPYYPIGTTCYAWVHQGDVLEKQTLATLKKSPFNKVRMCIFPKHYEFNRNEPIYHPFEASEESWDYERFNTQFFRHLEKRIEDLMKLGIEADIILFHPYDRWGYATMDNDVDDRYLRYVAARLSAYRNIWWSMANEYDLMHSKTMSDWDRFFQIVQESDPYQHLRSIHNARIFYDHGKPWVTHLSVQSSNFTNIGELRSSYKKPVIYDECQYEGNIERPFGNISAREMVHRFWLGTVAGCYIGHGETYEQPDDILWWSKGGILHGESPERIAFLRKILEEGPADGLEPLKLFMHQRYQVAGIEGKYYLLYFGIHQPARLMFDLPAENSYQVEIIDTWNMSIRLLEGTFQGKFEIELPGKPYMALRVQRI